MREFDEYVMFWSEAGQQAFYDAYAYFLGKDRVLSLEAQALTPDEKYKLVAVQVPSKFETVQDSDSIEELTQAQQVAEEVVATLIIRTLAANSYALTVNTDHQDIVKYWEQVSQLVEARANLRIRARQQN